MCRALSCADLVTQSIVLEWIKDALDSHTRNVAYTRVAFIRALAEYQKAIGKDPFIPPSGMLNGKTIFVPYIFTDDELEKFFMRLTVIKVVLFLNR